MQWYVRYVTSSWWFLIIIYHHGIVFSSFKSHERTWKCATVGKKNPPTLVVAGFHLHGLNKRRLWQVGSCLARDSWASCVASNRNLTEIAIIIIISGQWNRFFIDQLRNRRHSIAVGAMESLFWISFSGATQLTFTWSNLKAFGSWSEKLCLVGGGIPTILKNMMDLVKWDNYVYSQY